MIFCHSELYLSFLTAVRLIFTSTRLPHHRTMALTGGTSVHSGVNHGPIPETDASDDDGEERAGHQTCAHPSPGSCQG